MALEELENHLVTLPAGPIPDDEGEVEALLSRCWDQLSGSSFSNMEASKLSGRMERLTWTPPILTFVIERHGGTCCGSSRAELHQWTIDIKAGTASCAPCGFRQVRPRNKPQNTAELVNEVIEIVRTGKCDPRVSFDLAGEMRVHVGLIVPDDVPKETLAGRRKRFRGKLKSDLAQFGWKESRRPYRFHREVDST